MMKNVENIRMMLRNMMFNEFSDTVILLEFGAKIEAYKPLLRRHPGFWAKYKLYISTMISQWVIVKLPHFW